MTSRANDIKQKFAYYLVRLEALEKDISDAERNDADVTHLGIQVGEILGGCRECLDYCVRDIANHLTDDFPDADSVRNIYFPFSAKTVRESKGLYRELESKRPDIYAALLELAEMIDANADMDGIGPKHGHGILRKINNLVNEKKHNKITQTSSLDSAKILVEHPSGFSAVFSAYSITEDRVEIIQSPPLLTQQDMTRRNLRGFLIDETGSEAGEFCRASIKATSLIASGLYERFFGFEDMEFDPWEQRKPEDDRLADRAMRRFSPVLSRPIRIFLRNQDEITLIVPYHFDGDVENQSPEISAVGRFLLEVYKHMHAAASDGEFRAFLREKWRSVAEQSPEAVSVYEYRVKFSQTQCLASPSGPEYLFDEIIYGIQFKFRTRSANKVSYLPADKESWEMALAAIFNKGPAARVEIAPAETAGFSINKLEVYGGP